MTRKPQNQFTLLFGIALILTATSPLEATTLKLMNLADLVENSTRIFTGICQEVSTGLDENNLPYTSYSFRVTDSLYGMTNQQVVVVKQFGLREPIQLANGLTQVTRIEGMPHYVPGSEYMLLLNKESSLGFSAPIGLVQGAFLVQAKGSYRTVVNGMGNANLLIDTSKTTRQRYQERQQNLLRAAPLSLPDERVRGPVSYDNFANLVRSLLAGEPLDAAAASRLLGMR